MAYYSRRYTQKCVHVCHWMMGKGRGSLFNGRDRGPWRLSSPQLEALEERLGAVLLIQVGLIMPVHPLPLSLPPLHKIWKEMRDKGRQGGGGGGCVCVHTTCGHLCSWAWARGTWEISPPYYSCCSPSMVPSFYVVPLSRHCQLCWSCIRINQHPNNMANIVNWVRHSATIKLSWVFSVDQWTVVKAADSLWFPVKSCKARILCLCETSN